MKNKLLILGLLSLFTLGIVAAVLVPYLGNTVETNIEV